MKLKLLLLALPSLFLVGCLSEKGLTNQTDKQGSLSSSSTKMSLTKTSSTINYSSLPTWSSMNLSKSSATFTSSSSQILDNQLRAAHFVTSYLTYCIYYAGSKVSTFQSEMKATVDNNSESVTFNKTCSNSNLAASCKHITVPQADTASGEPVELLAGDIVDEYFYKSADQTFLNEFLTQISTECKDNLGGTYTTY